MKGFIIVLLGSMLTAGLDAADPGSAKKSDPIGELRFKFEVLEANLAKPLKEIDDRYEKALLELRKKVVAAGNLDYVLAVKKEIEEFRKGGGGAEGPTALAELRAAYKKESAPVRALFHAESGKLYEKQREDLLAYGRTAHEQGKTDEVERVKAELTALKERLAERLAAKDPSVATQAEPGVDPAFANWSGRGRYHVAADDRASIYINGELAYRCWLGVSVSELREVKVGDRITISLFNNGGPKHFRAAFASEQGDVVMNLRAKDFVEIGPLVGKRRSFTMDELAKGDAAAVKVIGHEWGPDEPLPVPNTSEWIWGEGDYSILAGIIKPGMFSRVATADATE